MPEISRFLGIVIRMYYRDHNPPHFHAEYGENEMTVEIASGMIDGKLPKRALAATLEWLELHREELEENWELARNAEPLRPIPPLE